MMFMEKGLKGSTPDCDAAVSGSNQASAQPTADFVSRGTKAHILVKS
jgi:hypothetical protein